MIDMKKEDLLTIDVPSLLAWSGTQMKREVGMNTP